MHFRERLFSLKLKKKETMNKLIKKPEILAPAGNMACLYAAINAGADAVYLAGNAFGARAYAGNFNNDELLHAIEIAHLYGVKVYLTVNTLLKNNEIKHLYKFLKPLYLAGLDAVLVQDLGVMRLISNAFPSLDIHASTQMNITSSYGAKLAKEIGLTRVVAARENSLIEMKKMKEESGLEIEAFVHGAMCFSFSGRCLLSSIAGGRSGNRGRCAQPCRKMYDGKYKMSMKDMCAITDLPKLIEAGIDSLKIEGRMKNEYYVAAAVSCYKEIAEDYVNGKYDQTKAEKYKLLLADIFNRGGFSRGYFFQHHGKDMIDQDIPGRRGVKALSILSVEKGKIKVKALTDINPHDDIAFLNDRFEEIAKLTTPKAIKKNAEDILNCPGTKRLRTGYTGYRVRNEYLLDKIYNEILKEDRKIPVSITVKVKAGENISLTAKLMYTENVTNDSEISITGAIIEKATGKAVSDKDLESKLKKLGDTRFYIKELNIINDSESFIPMSYLNQLRRELIEKLEKWIISSKYRIDDTIERSFDKSQDNISDGSKKIYITLSRADQLEAFLNIPEIACLEGLILDESLYGSYFDDELIKRAADKYKGKIFIAYPYILRDSFDKAYIKRLETLSSSYDGVYLRNIDSLYLYIQQALKKKVIVSASLYTYNDLAKEEYEELLSSYAESVIFERSYELNHEELQHLSLSNAYTAFYGKLPLMITAQKLTEDHLELTDELLNKFTVIDSKVTDLNIILNKWPLSLNKYRDEIADKGFIFTDEKPEEMLLVLDNYNNSNIKLSSEKITTGHFNRGVQ